MTTKPHPRGLDPIDVVAGFNTLIGMAILRLWSAQFNDDADTADDIEGAIFALEAALPIEARANLYLTRFADLIASDIDLDDIGFGGEDPSDEDDDADDDGYVACDCGCEDDGDDDDDVWSDENFYDGGSGKKPIGVSLTIPYGATDEDILKALYSVIENYED